MNPPLLTRLAFVGALLLPALAPAATVSALGRVLPRSGIIDIYGVAGDTIKTVDVKEGDWVEAGQSLATLSSAPAARQRVQQAETDLAATQQNTKRDIEIAQLQVASAELELKYASNRYDRIMSAGNSEFISPDQIETRTLGKEQAEVKLAQVQQDLARRRTESEQRIQAAKTELGTARGQLAAALVEAPLKLRVLKIRARVGSQIDGRTELFKTGDTSGMIVVAEVYESDALKVKPGQHATISSPALPGKMTGTVTGISPIVFRNTIESMDPNASTQARVVEATIRMDEVKPLDQFVFLQVDVTINL
jgi:HlyD family secretion protein